jgi:outer membrane lipoprotein-sorting protein
MRAHTSLSLIVFLACAATATAAGAPVDPVAQAIQRFADAWASVQSYTVTATVHEVKGARTQDRTYHLFFQKPFDTRAEIVAGDGRGSVAVWTGGTRVVGHQGGLLSFITLNLDIHNRLAVSLRGTTIAQANFGALLNQLQSLDPKGMTVTPVGENVLVSTPVHMALPDDDVARWTLLLGPDGLPVQSTEYAADGSILKQVTYSDLKLNVSLPPSTWRV